MSTLTRVFIVLMVIFSIAFTMTTISFVARTNAWKDLAQDYQAEQVLIETHMRNLAAAHAAEKAVWLDAKKALDDRIATLTTSEAAHLAEAAELNDEVARLRAEKSSGEALAHRLTSELQVAQNGWLEQREQRRQVEKRNLELERRNLDLNERVNEQTAQILVLVQQQRQLEQQVNILGEENAKLAGSTRAGSGQRPIELGGVKPAAPAASAPIRGRILEVQGKLATMSVGSADGVQKGMVFVIYRGSEYVGDIEVEVVEPNLSAGRLVRTRATPRPDDIVADETALGLAQ